MSRMCYVYETFMHENLKHDWNSANMSQQNDFLYGE